MSAASILIKPSSANCNIDCEYCFYKCLSSNREAYSKGFMTEETLEQLVMQAFAYAGDYVAFAFQGGEPTLAGIGFFEKAVELQKKYNTNNRIVENTIQTNGILLDENWAAFLAKNHFLVGLSLDGPKKLHDRYRKDVQGRGTFDRIIKAAALLEQYHVDYNIVSVITKESADRAGYLYKFFKKQGYRYLQLIPCMDERKRNQPTGGAEDLSGKPESFAVAPEQYGRFLCEMFDLWYADFCRGSQMDIRMFSNLAQMAAGYPAEECGMNGRCSCYFVVEGDGSVYPCDFYCTDVWRLGSLQESFQSLAESQKAGEFVAASEEVHTKCKKCRHFSLCRGGCRRWRETGMDGTIGLNGLCGAYELLFEHAQARIHKLGQYIAVKEAQNKMV